MLPLAKRYTGGAPVFPDLLERLHTSLPGSLIHAVYGPTEAEPIAHFDSGTSDEHIAEITATGGGLCAGLPVPNIALRIIRDHWGTPLGPMDEETFANITQPSGFAGEIVVSGNHVLQGYLDGIGNEETKIRVSDQTWHHTPEMPDGGTRGANSGCSAAAPKNSRPTRPPPVSQPKLSPTSSPSNAPCVQDFPAYAWKPSLGVENGDSSVKNQKSTPKKLKSELIPRHWACATWSSSNNFRSIAVTKQKSTTHTQGHFGSVRPLIDHHTPKVPGFFLDEFSPSGGLTGSQIKPFMGQVTPEKPTHER